MGKVFVACWSFEDADASGLSTPADRSKDTPPLDWELVRRMKSARLFLLTKGDVLVMPAGTYHYVYTIERKIVVAGDFLDGSCWTRWQAVQARDRQSDKSSCHKMQDLETLKAKRQNGERSASRASCVSRTSSVG